MAVLTWSLWPASDRPALPPPRARVYTAYSACLLTDSGGVTGPLTAPVWAGMQAASVRTAGKVSFLAVVGPATVDNARLYLNSLMTRHCDLVVAATPTEVAAVRAQAQRERATRFLTVDAGAAAGDGHAGSGARPQNLVVVPAGSPETVTAAIAEAVTRSAQQRGHR